MRQTRQRPACLMLLAAGVSLTSAPAATEDEFTVRQATTTLVNGVYHLSAAIDYKLTTTALEALKNGVPLTIRLDVEIYSPRTYMWNNTVATVEQRYELRYHALTEQVLVHHVNSARDYNYPNIISALRAVGLIADLPVLDQSLLDEGTNYLLRIRAVLDIEALPVPVRLIAYVSGGWHMASSWKTVPLEQ